MGGALSKMHRTHALLLILVASVVILAMHLAAFEYYLYWRFWWYDLIMHAMGGVIIASIALVFGVQSYARPVALAVVVGCAWEIMEYMAGIRIGKNYAFDTVLDVIADMSGAILLCAIVGGWSQKSQSPLRAEPVASPDQTSS
ncbi:MAG: hypothetical protein AAB573_00875 [Patescibacteria group bacterium]